MADRVAVGELREDFALYPRENVSATNVAALRDALNLGAEFPPVIAWRKTRAIIDGFHRVRAVKTEKGEYEEIAVEWRDYGSKGEAFADAVRLNASHGLRLGSEDYERIMQRAKHFGLKLPQLSGVMKVPVARLTKGPPPRHEPAVSRVRSPRGSTAELEGIARHDSELQSAIGGLAERLGREEVAPGQLPRVMANVKTARDEHDTAALRDALLEGAALFLWWAARANLSTAEAA